MSATDLSAPVGGVVIRTSQTMMNQTDTFGSMREFLDWLVHEHTTMFYEVVICYRPERSPANLPGYKTLNGAVEFVDGQLYITSGSPYTALGLYWFWRELMGQPFATT